MKKFEKTDSNQIAHLKIWLKEGMIMLSVKLTSKAPLSYPSFVIDGWFESPPPQDDNPITRIKIKYIFFIF